MNTSSSCFLPGPVLDFRQEMSLLKRNYNELKVTANHAFVEAQNAITRNCETLSMYVQEEIRESEQVADEVINELQRELEEAYRQIAMLQKNECEKLEFDHTHKITSHEDGKVIASESLHSISNTSFSCNSWRDFSDKFRDAISGKMPIDENKESALDAAAIIKAESLIKELCFEASVCSTKSLQSEDFLDAYEEEEMMLNCED